MSFEKLIGHLQVLRKAYPTIFSIQDEVDRLHDEHMICTSLHVSKSVYKKKVKKIEKMKEQYNTILTRCDKLAAENEKLAAENDRYKNVIAVISKRNDIAKSQLAAANDASSSTETKLREENARLQNQLNESEEQNKNQISILTKRNDLAERKLRDENARLQHQLDQNKNLQKEYNEKKIKALESRNGELESSLKTSKEDFEILQNQHEGIKRSKRALELQLQQKKRHFESLSTESPEIASKICEQQGYAITSSEPAIQVKSEPTDFCSATYSINNFMCRVCYYSWLCEVPKSGFRIPTEEIKTFSSQSELEDHFSNDHDHDRNSFLKLWQKGSIYICKEPDSKNGTCGFKSNSEVEYDAHLKVDHAKIQLLDKNQIYELRYHLSQYAPFRKIMPYQ